MRAFDPQSNFASTLMFEKIFNSENIFSVDPKMGTRFFRRNLKSQGISLKEESAGQRIRLKNPENLIIKILKNLMLKI